MIKLKNVGIHYFGRNLYRNVNIEIPLNQMTFIVGKSGSGKTTLINMIGGLEKNYQGQITLETIEKTVDLKKQKDSNLISFVFQNYNLFEKLSVLDNLKVGARINGDQWNKKEAMKKLQEFDFKSDIYKTRASELSGGEQQRISIIRALERDAKILLVDEPTGNLDEENSKKIFEELKKISKTRTVIVITHDEESALKYGDNIFSIDNANILPIRLQNSINSKEVDVLIKPILEKKTLKNKLSIMPALAVSDIRKRKITFSLLFITLVLFMFSVVSLSMLSNYVFDVRKNQITALDLDKATVSKNNFGDNLNTTIWTPVDTEKLKKNPNILQIVDEVAPTNRAQLSFNGAQISDDKDFKFYVEDIINNDFFKKRLEANGLLGTIVQNKNEIVLGKSFAEKIVGSNQKLESLIGQNVTLSFPDSKSNFRVTALPPVTLKVVGINTSKRYDGIYLNYISQDLWSSSVVETDVMLNLDSNKPYEINEISSLLEVINGSEKILPSSYSASPNSLLISKAVDDKLKKVKPSFNVDDEISISFPSISNSLRIKIGGVFDSNKSIVKLPQEEIDKLKLLSNKKRIYIDKNSNFNNVFEKIRNYKKHQNLPYNIATYIVREKLTSIRVPVLSQTSTVFIIVSGLAFLLFGIASIVSIITFAIMLNSAKKRDTTIMKLLGAKLWQLTLYSFGSTLIIIATLFVISLIWGFAFAPILLNNVLDYSPHVYVHYDRIFLVVLMYWSIMVGIFLVIFFLATFFSTLKSYKKLKANL